MARLPSTLGERAVPRARRNITSLDPGTGAKIRGYAAGEMAEGVRNLARGVGDAAQAAFNVDERRADVSLAEAKTQFLKDQIAIESSFDKDQDWQTYGKRYDEQIKKARVSAANRITDPRRRQAFELDAEVDVARGAASISQKSRVKETEFGRASVFGQIDSNLEAAVKTQDPQARSRLIDATLGSIKAAEKAGYLTPVEGQNQWNSFRAKYAEVYIKTLPEEEQLALLVGAPNVASAGIRRLNPGEFVQNADGTKSTERSITVTHPKLNNGRPTNIPSIWHVNGEIVELPFREPAAEDQAVEYALATGEKWASFDTIAQAEDAAKKRSNSGGRFSDAGTPMLPLQTEQAIGDDPYLKRLAWIESRGDPSARNPNSGALGLVQLMPATAKQYGVADPTDLKESIRAEKEIRRDNRTILRGTLGREPTDGELYLAHQQGASGAAALLANPDKNALVALTAVYGDVGRARAAIEQNGGDIDMTAGQFTSLWTQKFSGQPTMFDIAQGPPPGGYDFSKPTGTPVDFLSTETRLSLIESAGRGVKEKQDRARTAAQVDIALSIDDLTQSAFLTGRVNPSDTARILAAHPDAQGARMVRGLEEAALNGRDNNLVKSQSVEQDIALLKSVEAEANIPGPGSAAAAERYDRLTKAIGRKIDAINQDPANYVRQTNPTVQAAWDSATAEGAGPREIQQAVAISKAEQERLGVTRPTVMPKDVAASYTENFAAAKPEDAADLIEGMAKDFGSEWGPALGELKAAGLPGYAVVLGSLDRPEHAMFRTDLIEANKLGSEQLNKLVEKDDRDSVTEAISEQFMEFTQTLAHQTGGGELAAMYADSVRSVALYGMAKGAYLSPEEAATAAANAIIGHYQIYDTYRVPDIYDGETVSRGLSNVQMNLQPGDVLPVGTQFGAGLSNDFLAQQTVEALKTQGVWVTNENETGVYLRMPNGNFVARPDGSLFQIMFLDAETTAPVERPSLAVKQ